MLVFGMAGNNQARAGSRIEPIHNVAFDALSRIEPPVSHTPDRNQFSPRYSAAG